MSDPTAEVPGEAASPGDEGRESGAGVVGVAFGLLLIAALGAMVATQKAGPLDARELVASSFEVGELPFDLELAGGASLAGGEKLAVFRVPGLEEAPRIELPEHLRERDEDDEDANEYDWEEVVEGEAGSPPVEVHLVWYPTRGGKAAIERLFEDLTWKDLRDFGIGGGRLMREKDALAWAGYDAVYVLERELEEGGTFRDWMRVNLTLPGRACVLFARWARGLPGAKQPVEEILAVLRPVAEEGT